MLPLPRRTIRRQYGPVFSFTMFGSEITFALGSEASAEFWGTHNDVLNAEDLYRNLTVPVFGKGVAYDVPHKVRYAGRTGGRRAALRRGRAALRRGTMRADAASLSPGLLRAKVNGQGGPDQEALRGVHLGH